MPSRRLLTFAAAIVAVFSRPARAEMKIVDILSDHEVLIEVREEGVFEGDRLPVYSRTTEEILGFAEITRVKKAESEIIGGYRVDPNVLLATGRIKTHSQNGLITIGNPVRRFDYTQANESGFTGRSDLFLKGSKEISARYKPLVYQGATIGQTANTLDKNEHLFDLLGSYSYGLTNDIMISTQGALDVTGVVNVGAKWRAVDREWFTLAPAAHIYYRGGDNSARTYVLTAYLDMASNSKFISHTAINVQIDADGFGDKWEHFVQSSIQSGYEYVFDNWHRLLYGPKYNFEKKSIAGYVGYMFIWDHFHFLLSVQSEDFANFKLATDGYFPSAQLIWRL